jgi:hypothetical protein
MRIQPRDELLRIWKAAAQLSYNKAGGWQNHVGRREPNSISDAEQLLCFMLPATQLPVFRLERPDETHVDVLDSLRGFGGASEIPRVLVEATIAYLERYSDEDGTPQFAGGGAFDQPFEEGAVATRDQLDFDVVESFAVSIQLALAALGFGQVLREATPNSPDLHQRLARMKELASLRLSAAMVGLLRSFVINVFDVTDSYGQELLRTVGQGQDQAVILGRLKNELREVAARLSGLDIGNLPPKGLTDREKLFECGWTWGVAKGAPHIAIGGNVGVQREGYALVAPFLYFTVVALDGIEELDTDRTRLLNLLSTEQLDLANALRVRWELTQQYWATIATFGGRRWPLEDIPWRATDGQETDLFSLLVTSISARDLAVKRGTDVDLDRLGQILEELSNRGRVQRRPVGDDPSVGMHHPGVRVVLNGSETAGQGTLTWYSTDFAALLLKRTMAVAALVREVHTRSRLLRLADAIWVHIQRRRISGSHVIGQSLWDQPSQVFPSVEEYEQLSWHHTLRVIEALVITARMFDGPPLRSAGLYTLAEELLAEAEHMLDNEQLHQPRTRPASAREAISRLNADLERARAVLAQRPGSAIARTARALVDLDILAASRDAIDGRTD